MVSCGNVDAMWEIGRASQPALIELLDNLVPLIDTPEEAAAIEFVYRTTPGISFSRDMLERASQYLAAVELEGVEWSDWGKPDRIEATLSSRRARRAARMVTALEALTYAS